MGSNDDVKQNNEITDTDLVFLSHLAKQSAFALVFFIKNHNCSFPARYTGDCLV